MTRISAKVAKVMILEVILAREEEFSTSRLLPRESSSGLYMALLDPRLSDCYPIPSFRDLSSRVPSSRRTVTVLGSLYPREGSTQAQGGTSLTGASHPAQPAEVRPAAGTPGAVVWTRCTRAGVGRTTWARVYSPPYTTPGTAPPPSCTVTTPTGTVTTCSRSNNTGQG